MQIFFFCLCATVCNDRVVTSFLEYLLKTLPFGGQMLLLQLPHSFVVKISTTRRAGMKALINWKISSKQYKTLARYCYGA